MKSILWFEPNNFRRPIEKWNRNNNKKWSKKNITEQSTVKTKNKIKTANAKRIHFNDIQLILSSRSVNHATVKSVIKIKTISTRLLFINYFFFLDWNCSLIFLFLKWIALLDIYFVLCKWHRFHHWTNEYWERERPSNGNKKYILTVRHCQYQHSV